MKKILFLFLVMVTTGWANTINILNNSPYALKATITDASGHLLSEMTLNPEDNITWSDNQENLGPQYNPQASQTPYTVTWSCLQGTPYGVCTEVSPGSQVNAQDCTGNQSCNSP